jgi:predicted nucleotidyltransferase
MTPTERKALDDYVAAVRAHYGARLVDILVFGSRARGDARPDSDLDLAVILEDGDWKLWDEQWLLADLAYEPLIDDDLHIQPLPIRRSAWQQPALHHNPTLIEAMHRDAKSLAEFTADGRGGVIEQGDRLTPTERRALDDYVASVRAHYGRRLVDILVFGSRARGDARRDSDVDLVVLLDDGDWKFREEKRFLTDLAYDAMIDPGLWIQAWPASRTEWKEEDEQKVPFFVIGARSEARPVSEAQ